MKVSITNENELPRILELIHDEWFESSGIFLNDQYHHLIIPFEREIPEKRKLLWKLLFIKREEIPIFKHELVILHVNKFSIKDDAKINRYDFNTLHYDSNLKKLTITSGFPYSIDIWMNEFAIEVKSTEKLIQTKKVWNVTGDVFNFSG